mgnify:CR=1 FL=1
MNFEILLVISVIILDNLVSIKDGYLINVGDYDDYVRKVIKICKDDDLRKSFGRKATENSERFSTLNISKKWIGLLDVIL